jgi:hypothetical protein
MTCQRLYDVRELMVAPFNMINGESFGRIPRGDQVDDGFIHTMRSHQRDEIVSYM